MLAYELTTGLPQDVASFIRENALRWDESRRIDRQSWKQLGDFRGLEFDLSGPGFKRTASSIFELGRMGYAGVRAAITVNAIMAMYYLQYGGSSRFDNVMQGVRKGECVLALALTEEAGGSSPDYLETQTSRDQAGAVWLNGRKAYVSNGSIADYFIVIAGENERSGALLTADLYLIPRSAPGVHVEPVTSAGWGAADMAMINIDNVKVDDMALLGSRYSGLRTVIKCLAFERLVAAIAFVGECRAVVDLTVNRLMTRNIGNVRMSKLQSPRFEVARWWSEVTALELACGKLAQLYAEEEKLSAEQAGAIKLLASETLVRMAPTAMRFHGAAGYVESSSIHRLYRDAVASTIAAGSSEALLETIARQVFRDSSQR